MADSEREVLICCECGNDDGPYNLCLDCLENLSDGPPMREPDVGAVAPMYFNAYQNNTDITAMYPEAGTGSMLALAYVGLGLGEAGEVQGKLKKILRDDGGVLTDAKRADIAAELGDLLWYVARCATEIDYPLSNIAEANLAKLWDRKSRNVLKGSGDNR